MEGPSETGLPPPPPHTHIPFMNNFGNFIRKAHKTSFGEQISFPCSPFFGSSLSGHAPAETSSKKYLWAGNMFNTCVGKKQSLIDRGCLSFGCGIYQILPLWRTLCNIPRYFYPFWSSAPLATAALSTTTVFFDPNLRVNTPLYYMADWQRVLWLVNSRSLSSRMVLYLSITFSKPE